MSKSGAFVAPGMFELLYDRVTATRFPSIRLVSSATMSATSVAQLDRLIGALGRQSSFLHLSPRRLELLGIVVRRRVLLELTGKIKRAGIGELPDGSDDSEAEVDRDDLADAVALLKSTSKLLN